MNAIHPAILRPLNQTIVEQIAARVMLTHRAQSIGARASPTRAALRARPRGHSEASYEEARPPSGGARAFTHLFNAMSPSGRTLPGMVCAALVSPAFVRILARRPHVLSKPDSNRPHGHGATVCMLTPTRCRRRPAASSISTAGPPRYPSRRCLRSTMTAFGLLSGPWTKQCVTSSTSLRVDLGDALAMAAGSQGLFSGATTKRGRIAPGIPRASCIS